MSVRDSRAGPAGTSAPQPRRALVEDQIKNAAAGMFLANGIANTSLGDIATALGVTRTALYHYYKSKDELLVALIRECAADARHILDAHRRSGRDGRVRRRRLGGRSAARSHPPARAVHNRAAGPGATARCRGRTRARGGTCRA